MVHTTSAPVLSDLEVAQAQVRAVLLVLQEHLQQSAPALAQQEARVLPCTLWLLPQQTSRQRGRHMLKMLPTGAASKGGHGAAWRGCG